MSICSLPCACHTFCTEETHDMLKPHKTPRRFTWARTHWEACGQGRWSWTHVQLLSYPTCQSIDTEWHYSPDVICPLFFWYYYVQGQKLFVNSNGCSDSIALGNQAALPPIDFQEASDWPKFLAYLTGSCKQNTFSKAFIWLYESIIADLWSSLIIVDHLWWWWITS